MKKQTLRVGNYFKAEILPRNNRLPGFTIVELLIVIVVIGILAAISIVAYNGVQVRATDSTTKLDAGNAGKQLELAKATEGTYPPDASDLNRSEGTSYIYTQSGDSYQLTAHSNRPGTKAYCITSENRSVVEGACSGHSVPVAGEGSNPVATADGCFRARDVPGGVTIAEYFGGELVPGGEAYATGPMKAECPKDVVVPSQIGGKTVVAIGGELASNDFAFIGRSITSVTIPDSVTSIGTYAFYNNQLTSVTIPNSVTSIGRAAFHYNQLTSVTIPSSVTSIGGGAFDTNQLTSVTIPSSVTSIEESAFSYNQLTSVTIPSSVTSIEESAFGWNELTSVIIPSSVTSIGSGAFSFNKLASVTIPSSVKIIEYDAFRNNQLTSVTIPSSVTSIGTGAFRNNTGINCRIPNSTPYDPLNPNIYCATIERY